MKYFKNFLFFLLTIALVFFGAFLPSIVFSHQNSQIQSQVKQYTMEQTQFRYSLDLMDTLYLVSQPYVMKNPPKENINSTEEEIYETAMSFIEDLSSYKIINYNESDITTYSEEVFFAMEYTDKQATSIYSSSSSDADVKPDTNSQITEKDDTLVSAILWNLAIKYEDGESLLMIIDDLTKKVVSFTFAHAYMDPGKFDYLMSQIEYFTKDYYNFNSIEKLESIITQKHTDSSLRISLICTASSGQIGAIPVEIGMDYIFFNVYL